MIERFANHTGTPPLAARATGWFGRFAGAVLGAMLMTLPAVAQPQGMSFVPPEFIDESRDINEDEISFCLNMSSALVELDREVAQAIGDALLLNVRFHEVVSPFNVEPYDFRIPLAERDLFVTITNHCQAFMGLRLSAGQIPQWLTVSAPYLRTRSVFATTDPAVTAFSDLGAGTKTGSRLGSPGDTQYTAYLRALPEDRRPRRFPYPNNGVLLERLGDGSVSTIYIWEPALYLASEGDPAALGVTASFEPPFGVPAVDFAVAFLSQDTFTRGLIDDAIAALAADGTLGEIIARYDIGGGE